MNAAITEMTHCPEPETLAAFVDGRLNAAERQEVMNHMAECAECRDNVLLSTEIVAMETPAKAAASAVVPAWGAKVWVPLAAAASIAVLVAVPLLRPNSMGEVVKTAKTVRERPNDARLDLDVPYQPAKSAKRGSAEVGSIETEIAALSAADHVAENPTVENFHAAGIAYMYYGKHGKAVEMLERAAAAKTPSVALLNNLTAAYLGVGRYEDALKTSDRSLAIEQTPIATWNRALALERLDRSADAIAVWERYTDMETAPEWIAEARQHIAELRKRP